MISDWHIWYISKYNLVDVKFYIKKHINEIESVFLPTVGREVFVGRKRVTKRVPLYSGYIFLRYTDCKDKKIFYKIKKSPFGVKYIGSCNQDDIDSMIKKESWNSRCRGVRERDLVEIICGPFAGMKGIVNSIRGNKVTVDLMVFDRVIDCTVSSDSLEILDR
jgi:transcription antitermination factor NusG